MKKTKKINKSFNKGYDKGVEDTLIGILAMVIFAFCFGAFVYGVIHGI